MLFYAGLLPSPSSISLPPKKTLRICANPMTQHGRGRVSILGTCPCPHQWLGYCFPLFYFVSSTADVSLSVFNCDSGDDKFFDVELVEVSNY